MINIMRMYLSLLYVNIVVLRIEIIECDNCNFFHRWCKMHTFHNIYKKYTVYLFNKYYLIHIYHYIKMEWAYAQHCAIFVPDDLSNRIINPHSNCCFVTFCELRAFLHVYTILYERVVQLKGSWKPAPVLGRSPISPPSRKVYSISFC